MQKLFAADCLALTFIVTNKISNPELQVQVIDTMPHSEFNSP